MKFRKTLVMQKYNLNTLFNKAYNVFTKVKIVNIITK